VDAYFDPRVGYFLMAFASGGVLGALLADSFNRAYLPSDWHQLPLKWRLFRWVLGVGLAIMVLFLIGIVVCLT
jgi:hypothetical protein